MGLSLTFEVRFLSDYHAGAGHGLGVTADSALHRDADGVPVLRGTLLRGLLRDSLRALLQLPPLAMRGYCRCRASGLSDKNDPSYCGQQGDAPAAATCPVCRIFGSPRQPTRWRVGSGRPAGWAKPGRVGQWLSQDDRQVTPHVRISPRSRRAEARKLFFREDGDQRLTFQFTLDCAQDDAAAQEEAALLVAAARHLRHVGARRRRGVGECRLHLVDSVAESNYLKGFRSVWLERSAATPIPATKPDDVFTASGATDFTPVRVRLLVRLDEPLLIARRAEAGNQFQTVDHIPGSALRGALAAQVKARHGKALAEKAGAAYDAFLRLFFRDAVRFPPLYPLEQPKGTEDIYPAIVTPADLFTCELFPGFSNSNGHGVWGLATDAPTNGKLPTCPTCHNVYKTDIALEPLAGFQSLRPGRTRPVAPMRVAEMHPRLDPETQRVATGDLFGYEALAPGQYFVGELWCRDASAWADLRLLTGLPEEGEWQTQMGKAQRRGGYGQATMWIEPLPANATHLWRALPLEQRVTDLNAPLVLTLLTDAIVVDDWGRFREGFGKEWLTSALGLPVKTLRRAFATSRVVDSFNAHLGLPRWRDVALRAGATVGLELDTTDKNWDSLDKLHKALRDIEQEGIGLRRNEGFGQVVFNHPLRERSASAMRSGDHYIELPKPWRQSSAQAPAGDTVQDEAQFRKNWRERLDEVDWTPFERLRFEALARFLHREQPANPEQLAELLEGWGQRKNLLPAALLEEELAVWAVQPSAKREFLQNTGQEGARRLNDLASELATQSRGNASHWRIGLVMLLERIGDATRQKEE